MRVVLSSESTLAQKMLVDEAVSIVDNATIEGCIDALRILLTTLLSHILTDDNSEQTSALTVLQMTSSDKAMYSNPSRSRAEVA